ncbi:hypothetical protein B0T09DRAFT_402786 [Sordaria sp. MPI-SDFR-AT-0083]|nr:hypothetical protein B0T09DRAFT_402786 [Sordaria sp. MPI-SDFR-AT-0083]
MVAAPFSRHMCLFGFDHDTQARLVFDNIWAASFLTRSYTDEKHEYVKRFDADQHAKQELKYGNNVYVLFKALLYCGKYWGQDSFWSAIGRGFSAKAVYVEELTYMLMEARKIQRTRRQIRPHDSDVTRAVDDWMAFLDAHGPELEMALRSRTVRAVTDPRLTGDADSFFASMRGTLVNCNNIPLSLIGRPPCPRILAATRTPYRPIPPIHHGHDLPPRPASPPVKNEPRPAGTGWEYLLEPNRNAAREPLRKRSGSPFSRDSDDNPPYKRHHGSSEWESEQQSPPRWNYPEPRVGSRQRDERPDHDEFDQRSPPLVPRSGDFWPPRGPHVPQSRVDFERQQSLDEQRQKEEQLRRLEQQNQELQKKVQEFEAQRRLEQQREQERLEQQRLDKELDEMQKARSQQHKEKMAGEKKRPDAQKKPEQQRPEEQTMLDAKKKKTDIHGPRPSHHPSVLSSDEEVAGLKDKISTLEKKLADTEGQLKAAAVIRPLERSMSKFQSDLSTLHGDMNTLFDSFQSMVDLMTHMQEDVICIKETAQGNQQQHGGIEELSLSVENVKENVALVLCELSDIRLQHQQLEKKVVAAPFRAAPSRDSEALMTALTTISQKVGSLNNEMADLRKEGQVQRDIAPPTAANPSDLKDLMGIVRTTYDNVDMLKNDVRDLKEQRARTNDTSAASGNISGSVDAELIKALFGEQKALIQSQNQRLDRMAKEISSLQTQVYASGRTQPQPKNLKQAMAAAEKDLQHHLITMQSYRNKMADQRNPPSTVLTMADMCQTLEACIQYSKAGQK